MGYVCVLCGNVTDDPKGSMKFPHDKECYDKNYKNSEEYWEAYAKAYPTRWC